MIDNELGFGFLAFLFVGALGVFLTRGAPYFLPRSFLDWPVLGTLNRFLPGALILLFFLVTWITKSQDGTLKAWVFGLELGILLLAIGAHLLLRQVLVTIAFAVLLHYLIFYHAVPWVLANHFSWSP